MTMLFTCGVCPVRPSGRKIFSKEVCEGFTAPPAFAGAMASEPARQMLYVAETKPRPLPLADAIHAAFREQDKVAVQYPPKWDLKYANRIVP